MSSDESTDDENYNEEEILRNYEEEAQNIINGLLPPKSRELYEKAYSHFDQWKISNPGSSYDENSLLVYFKELTKKFKPPSLWSHWSKLKATFNLKHNIKIENYGLLKTFLKNYSKGYKAKKSLVLTWSQIDQFLKISEDSIYLAIKVIAIFGIFGAMRCKEMVNLRTTDVQDTNINVYVVTIHDTKTYYPRNFVIGAEYYEIVKKYISLRPDNTPTDRFFLRYQNSKCTRQVIGKEKIAESPKTIANYLQLENTADYTGHCFRRSAATALSNRGANLNLVKQLGGWLSDAVAQGYIDFSLQNRIEIFEKISGTSISKQTENNSISTVSKFPEKQSTVLVDYTNKPSSSKDLFQNVDDVPSTTTSHQQLALKVSAKTSADLVDNENLQNLSPKQSANFFSNEDAGCMLFPTSERQPLGEHQLNNNKNIVYNKPPSKKIRLMPNKNTDDQTSQEVSSLTFQNCNNCVIHKIVINHYHSTKSTDENSDE